MAGPHPHSLRMVGLGWGPRICISNKFPHDSDAEGLENPYGEPPPDQSTEHQIKREKRCKVSPGARPRGVMETPWNGNQVKAFKWSGSDPMISMP